MDIFTILWSVWAAGFAVVEGFAFFNKRKGDTLSEKVWKIFKVPAPGTKAKTAWTIQRFGLLAFLVWLLLHLGFGWLNT